MNGTQGIFSVTLLNPEKNFKKTIQVSPDEYILDVAKQNTIDLPYSCCTGRCTSCAGKVLEGTAEQTTQALHFLSREQVNAGYILTCAAYPTSDCVILTHQEEELF